MLKSVYVQKLRILKQGSFLGALGKTRPAELQDEHYLAIALQL
jgi:hypothetical protein